MKDHKIDITKEDIAKAWAEVSPGYDGIKLKDPDILIQGMLHIARRPIAGVAPDMNQSVDSMWSVFLQQLLTSAIEAGSKGVSFE